MGQFDTSLGGPERPFPSTLWSELLLAGDRDRPDHRAKLDRLVQTYWKPVYVYIRAGWRKSVEDAKDLTQSFLTYFFVEKDYLARMRPERGSFRGYLRQALKHFLISAEKQAALRRRADSGMRIEATPGQWEALEPIAENESPESAYDREWFACLMEETVDTLHHELAEAGKEAYFEVFRRYCLEDPAKTYQEVAEALSLTEADVRHYLEYGRTVFRRVLRRKVRETVMNDEDVEEEFREALRE